MRNALVLSALGLAGCCLSLAELRAQSSANLSAPNGAENAIIAELRAAVASDPTAASSRIRLGYLLIEQGQADEGMRWVLEGERLDPSLGGQNRNLPGVGGGSTRANNTGTIQDVWVCSLPGTITWNPLGETRAYSIATTSANQGNANLDWNPNTVAHPVIAQNLYRLKNGRLDMVGMSWLKHGFCALQNSGCGSCKSAGGGCPPRLGPGCSDPYDSGLNGTQFRLGPHSEVNPVLGTYTLPHGVPDAGAYTNISGRLQVLSGDIDVLPTLTKYYIEGQYVHPEDSADGRQMNNASYREVTFNSSFLMSNAGGGGPPFPGATVQQKQAIYAWQAADPSVTILDVDVAEGAGVGRFTVAYKVTNIDSETWHYEYAIHNMNSDRGASGFVMPRRAGVIIWDQGFHDCPYHSGDGVGGVNYDGTDWFGFADCSTIGWVAQTSDANANALRWGTLYNFWFDANTPPADMTATLNLFKSGPAPNPTFTVQGPSARRCPNDLDGDGQVNATDIAIVLGNWNGCGIGDLDGDGFVNATDVAFILGDWGPC